MSEVKNSVETPEVKNSAVLFIQLVTGVEIIAKTAELEEGFVVQDPVQLVASDDGNGKVRMGLASFLPYVKDGVLIPKTSVLAIGEPQDSLLDSYREMTTGIVVPNNKIIAGI